MCNEMHNQVQERQKRVEMAYGAQTIMLTEGLLTMFIKDDAT